MSLISVEDALALVLRHARPLEAEVVPLLDAYVSGRVLATALTATRPLPPFDVSAMDGYAVRAASDLPPRASMAACAAAKEGAKVVVVEPSRWLGGMTGGGLMHVDWGREEAVSGSTRPILKQGFEDPQYRATFVKMLADAGIPVIYDHRVCSVEKTGGRIRSITLDRTPFDATGCPPTLPTQVAALP